MSSLKFRSLRGVWSLVAASTVVALVGCGSGEKLHTVQGKVVYSDGQPVTGGAITFNNAAKQLSATSEIAEDGSFDLEFGDSRGAPAGDYQVTVTGKSDYGEPPTVADVYGDPTRSPLTQTIVEGTNDLEIKVERPK